MSNFFYEAATKILNSSITEWKENGGKIVGCTCSYVPGELLHAAGILPVRIRGIETTGTDIGDAYFGPFICSFPKCVLQLVGKGKYGFLDGTIITPGCDSMRRLDECWRKAGEDYEGIVPPYFYYFDVPHKTLPHGMKWFKEEIVQLVNSLEKHFGVKIEDDAVKDSIALYNKGRHLLKELEELRKDQDVRVTGTEAFAVTIAGTVLPREVFTTRLEQFIGEIKNREPVGRGKKRIMLIGSISDDIGLVELIEKNRDAIVVAENLCFGVRYEGHMISESGEPVDALAEGYLGGSICPRMFGKYKERLALLKQRIDEAAVDGVIMQNIRFCDLHGSEHGLFERDLEKAGIPCLKLEREYGPLTETGRIQMRIQAFLERISSK